MKVDTHRLLKELKRQPLSEFTPILNGKILDFQIQHPLYGNIFVMTARGGKGGLLYIGSRWGKPVCGATGLRNHLIKQIKWFAKQTKNALMEHPIDQWTRHTVRRNPDHYHTIWAEKKVRVVRKRVKTKNVIHVYIDRVEIQGDWKKLWEYLHRNAMKMPVQKPAQDKGGQP